uniref:Protein kinase APK1B, chloroplast n=1 Tax=Solanum tuberosum TaxID=4113 RepID=M1B213_SOLTU
MHLRVCKTCKDLCKVYLLVCCLTKKLSYELDLPRSLKCKFYYNNFHECAAISATLLFNGILIFYLTHLHAGRGELLGAYSTSESGEADRILL